MNVSPLIFSPYFCSHFFCAIVDVSQWEMETSLSGSLGLLPAYLKRLYSFLSFLKIFQPLNCKGFRVCSCLLRTFCLLSMNDNKYKSAEDFKVSFIVVKQDLHWTTSSLLLQPSPPASPYDIWRTPHFSFRRRLFSLSDKSFVFTCLCICCCSRRYCLNPTCLLQKQIHKSA